MVFGGYGCRQLDDGEFGEVGQEATKVFGRYPNFTLPISPNPRVNSIDSLGAVENLPFVRWVDPWVRWDDHLACLFDKERFSAHVCACGITIKDSE